MNKKLEDYLDTIDHYLKPMPASERIDIVNEIKSELSELELQNDLTADEIIDKMGNPKELAKAYLFLSVAAGLLFFLAGRGLLKLLLSYIRTVSHLKQTL